MSPATRAKHPHVVCDADELRPGERKIVRIRDGLEIGVFNVDGRLYALHNRCPHRGAPLCAGRVGGTTLYSGDYTFPYGREGEIVRCAWHGWEFEIATGRALAETRARARTYPVDVHDGQIVVTV